MTSKFFMPIFMPKNANSHCLLAYCVRIQRASELNDFKPKRYTSARGKMSSNVIHQVQHSSYVAKPMIEGTTHKLQRKWRKHRKPRHADSHLEGPEPMTRRRHGNGQTLHLQRALNSWSFRGHAPSRNNCRKRLLAWRTLHSSAQSSADVHTWLISRKDVSGTSDNSCLRKEQRFPSLLCAVLHHYGRL